jgi:hypothetical protein
MARSRLIETIGLGFFGAAPEPSTVDPRDVQPSPRTSFVTAIREQDAYSVDAVAGSEFVDDRLRLQE